MIESMLSVLSKEDKVNAFEILLKDPDIQPFLNPLIDARVAVVLATSDLQVLKRLKTIEQALGLNGMENEEQQTIPEQINLLADRIDNLTEKPIEPIKEEPKTSLDCKAVELFEHLNKVKPRHGNVFMDSSELNQFLEHGLTEDLRGTDTNLRRVKKKVIERARDLFPDMIKIDKLKGGRHETRIVLKDRTDCTRRLGTVQY